MAIARDSYSAGSTASSASSKTWSHTISGSNTILVVFGYVEGFNTLTATYNGVSMTLGTSAVDSSFGRSMFAFYLVNPAGGTNNVVLTNSGTSYMFGSSVSYTGSAQTGQPDASNSKFTGGSVSDIDVNVTTVTNNDWICGYARMDNSISSPHGTGAFTIITGSSGESVNTFLLDTNGPISPAASTSVGLGTSNGSANGWIVALAIKPVGAAPANGNFLALLGVGI